MTQTNAQIQAAYRVRHLKDESATGSRLDLVIDSTAMLALKRLAAHYRITQRAMVQDLITGAQTALLDTMTSDQQAAYYDAKRP